MAYMRIKVGSTILPSPTSVNLTDEILWSSSTGRSVSTGEMMGASITGKRTLEIEWQWITATEFANIMNALPRGFFSNVVYESTTGVKYCEMEKAYRGNFTREDAGTVDSKGTHYYKSVKVSIIEK